MKLPLDAILKNNVALSYFIDYVTNIGEQSYLFFYLNVEGIIIVIFFKFYNNFFLIITVGWKVTAEQQIANIECNKMKGINENTNIVYDKIRETAFNIYDQYLSEKSQHKLDIHPKLVQTLFFRIKNLTDQPSELWFDDIQKFIYDKMQTQDDFLPGFERSSSYLRLLAEFDLIGQTNLEEDELSLSSLDTVEMNSETQSNKSNNSDVTNDLPEKDYLSVTRSDSMQKITKHARSYSDITDIAAISKSKQENKAHKSESHQQFDLFAADESISKPEPIEPEEDYSKLKVGNFTLSVDIIEAGELKSNIYFNKLIFIEYRTFLIVRLGASLYF